MNINKLGITLSGNKIKRTEILRPGWIFFKYRIERWDVNINSSNLIFDKDIYTDPDRAVRVILAGKILDRNSKAEIMKI
jgi:hypothetical protein